MFWVRWQKQLQQLPGNFSPDSSTQDLCQDNHEALEWVSEVLLSEEQHGFRKGHSCLDCVLAIKQIIKKRQEFNQETHILFVDYVKAFEK
jgi:hypothetical protein